MIVDAMYDMCGCRDTTQKIFEFEIEDDILQCNCNCEEEKKISKDNFCSLKNKVIGEFLDIIKKLECGIQPDLELILQEISLIYIYDE